MLLIMIVGASVKKLKLLMRFKSYQQVAAAAKMSVREKMLSLTSWSVNSAEKPTVD